MPRPLLSLTELISLWIYYKWVLTTHGANQLAHLLRHARPPRLTLSDPPRPEQAKAFAVPADDGRGFDDKDAGLPVVPDGAEPSPEQPIRRCQFRSLDGALQNAELMAECEDLELKRRTAPEGSEKRGQKSGQYLPERESKEERQLPVDQSDRIFREPQVILFHQAVEQRLVIRAPHLLDFHRPEFF